MFNPNLYFMNRKVYQPDKNTGIWIDQHQAYLIKLSGEHSPDIEKHTSTMQSRLRTPGEEKPFTRFEETPFDHQEKEQRHQHNEQRKYYQAVVNSIRDQNYVYIFGPGKAKQELNNAIEKEGPHFPCKVVALEAADKLTENQMLEKVKHYFSSLSFEDTKRRMTEKKG